ncbi:F-box domain-containing protein [Mycena kentingensis (nom. inval.)]|nr:F-box domain-containing protein [Mycena kentingensis (nom. inval.)]
MDLDPASAQVKVLLVMSPGSELRAQIDKLAGAISDLENRAAVLRAQQTQLECALAAIVYPVLTIPHEITSEILVRAAPSSSHFDRWPLVAASVCRQWRQIALSAPALWSTLALTLEYPVKAPSLLLETWILRSGALTLDLTVRLMRHEVETATRIMQNSVARWSRVVLSDITCLDHNPDAEPAQPYAAPHLALHGRVLLPDIDPAAWPALRSLVLCRHRHIAAGLISTRVLSGITSLMLHDVEPADAFAILAQTPAVEVLSVRLHDEDMARTDPQARSAILLGQLHTLRIDADELLGYLTLPALTTLVVNYMLPGRDSVAAFIAQPGSELSVILNFVGAVITGRILPLVDRATLRAVPGLFLFYLVQVLRQSVFDRQAMMEDATSPPPLGIRVQIVGDSDEEDLAGLRALHEEFPWVAIEEVEIILSGN